MAGEIYGHLCYRRSDDKLVYRDAIGEGEPSGYLDRLIYADPPWRMGHRDPNTSPPAYFYFGWRKTPGDTYISLISGGWVYLDASVLTGAYYYHQVSYPQFFKRLVYDEGLEMWRFTYHIGCDPLLGDVTNYVESYWISTHILSGNWALEGYLLNTPDYPNAVIEDQMTAFETYLG